MNTHDNNTNETETQISGICDNYMYEIYKDRVVVRSIEWLSADENQLWIQEPLYREILLTTEESYIQTQLSKISENLSKHIISLCLTIKRREDERFSRVLQDTTDDNLIQGDLFKC